MGVIHKLKEEVVSFVITQKQENPRVSCRGLTSIVNERFQINVSKSSINAILKDAQLSSMVGRRPLGEKTSRKFKLPPQKKSELFGGISPLEPNPPQAKIPVSRREPTPKVHRPETSGPPGPIPAPQPVSVDKALKIVKAEPDPVKKISDRELLDKGVLYDGMGCYFLKAAQWELSSSSAVGKILSKYLGGKITTELDTVGNVLLFSRAFGLKNSDEIRQYQNQGLWALNGLKDKMDHHLLTSAIEGINDSKNLLQKIANEGNLPLTEINHIRISLEDRSEVLLDAQLNSLWNDNVQPGFSSPMDRTLQILSTFIVNNVQPLVIRSIPGRKEFSSALFGLLSAFENLEGKRINKVAVCDSNNEAIAQFSIIPNKRRLFMIGAWPWQKEFAQYVSEDTHHIKSHYQGELDQEIYYSELKTKFYHEHLGGKQSPMRVILLRESKKEGPEVAIVTNALEDQLASAEIVSAYFLRWPNLQKGYMDFIGRAENPATQHSGPLGVHSQRTFSPSKTDFLEPALNPEGLYPILDCFLADLHDFCLRHYFSSGFNGQEFAKARERIYGLPGYFRKVQNTLVVTLAVPEGYLFLKDLEYAVRRVRESDVVNNWGGKLVLELSHYSRTIP